MGLGPGGAGASGGQGNDGGAGPGGMGAGPGGENDGMGDGPGGWDNLGYDANEPGGGITMESIKPSKNNKNFITPVLNFIFNKIPGLSLVNLGVNAVTGKTIAEHLSSVAEKAMSSAVDSGATESQATEAGKQAIANAISEMPSNSFGGGEGKSQALAAIQGVNPSEVTMNISGRVGPVSSGTDATQSNWDSMLKAYDTTSINNAIKAIQDADTDIQYQHTLADLSGIKLDDNEKALLEEQKAIAIDRTINEIEDTFAQEGDSIVAQQIQNLGTNALGGTIGQGFIKRWEEREAKTKTAALQDIESTYLAAEQAGIDRNKQLQVDMWGKEYDADVKDAELNLDKAKSTAAIQYDWDRSYLDRITNLRGQDINAEQQNLDRLLKEKMGDTEYDAWQESNKWGTISNIGGSIVGSDWFNDIVSDWF